PAPLPRTRLPQCDTSIPTPAAIRSAPPVRRPQSKSSSCNLRTSSALHSSEFVISSFPYVASSIFLQWQPYQKFRPSSVRHRTHQFNPSSGLDRKSVV